MNVLITTVKEIFGLFVEDGSYALAIVVWLLLAAWAVPHLVGPSWRAPLLFAGLLLILCESTLRSARQHGKR